MAKRELYRVLAAKVAWKPPAGTQYVEQKREEIKRLLDLLPSGAGWDMGTRLADNSSGERLVLYGEFHHMDENGFYSGWTEHEIIVTPSLQNGFSLRISGRDRNQIKDYLYEMFDYILRQEIEEYAPTPMPGPATIAKAQEEGQS